MSKFVSSGTDQEPTERDSEWLEAQKAVEARHLAKIEAGKQQGGKSLYETLQANKAKDAKQEAFEESIRLRNQFRSLDDDEIEFLDSVAQAERSKEAEIRREAKVQLEAFKSQQQEAEKASNASLAAVEPPAVDSWTTGSRKRKKEKEFIGIIKKRQLSSSDDAAIKNDPVQQQQPEGKAVSQQSSVPAAKAEIKPVLDASPASSKKPLLGLGGYSSEED